MDVAFVGEEGVASTSHTVEVDAEHVEAGYHEGGEGYHSRIVVEGEEVGLRTHHCNGTEHEHHARGQGSRIAHEYLLPACGIAEYIIIEEGEEGARSSGCKHGIYKLTSTEEDDSIEDESDCGEA